ncbi:hypothetical protein IFM89_021156 [Coptis chinensis]|uniref:Uncharacterized protein n=1 Tax=Coptis chinensis TaxID=261450 RepID=A0A835I584_9MAGN|nr:hypothetical protein IFM89_021156 [Coptis chinensis]
MANGTTKNVYTDVFGGGPKFKIPSFSSKVEDYTDIFSSYHSGASSIPVLDLPVVGDDEIVDAQSLKFDYKEIFGGFDDDDDYAVPYQELFFDTKAEEESDSDEDVW